MEAVEEEFRRTIRSYEGMSFVWTELGKIRDPGGHRAYAMQKADAFRRMGEKGRSLFKAAGGTWPAEGKSLFEHVQQLRKRRRRCVPLSITKNKHLFYVLLF